MPASTPGSTPLSPALPRYIGPQHFPCRCGREAHRRFSVQTCATAADDPCASRGMKPAQSSTIQRALVLTIGPEIESHGPDVLRDGVATLQQAISNTDAYSMKDPKSAGIRKPGLDEDIILWRTAMTLDSTAEWVSATEALLTWPRY